MELLQSLATIKHLSLQREQEENHQDIQNSEAQLQEDDASSSLLNMTTGELLNQSSFLPSSATTVFISTLLGILILITLIGNFFVIFAISMDRHLKRVGNYLILSLAVADSLVALSVMPIGAIYEVAGEWQLGAGWCEFWTSADVLCCAASILHLVAIALDRFWTVTYVEYIHRRDKKCVLKMLAVVWLVSAVVSLAPFFGWQDAHFSTRVLVDKTCMVSQDVAYQIFATCATFYLPLVVILLLYWKIYKVRFSSF